jgi:uncharacterized protein YcbK (DUF882 family)
VSGKIGFAVIRLARQALAAMLSVAIVLPAATAPAAASGERTLYLYYTHTGETARITFWRNGHFDQRGLNELNHFLRDWRRNESIEMDPNLFNLIWRVYQEVGATQPINVVSAYRSPATNEMLRSRSSAVAKNSRHTHGQAMDFFIPGIPISKLREVAMRYQVGGVGYYPSSGSPFVHLDTGNVRAWPRMTRAQLQNLFPDGKTLHLPPDGVPLSQSGRQYAAAEWQRCHQIPCSSRLTGGSTRLASASDGERRNLLDLFRGDQDETDDVQLASAPTQRTVTTQPVPVAPTPPARPDSEILLAEAELAPAPPIKPEAIRLATLTGPPAARAASADADRIAVADVAPPPAPARGLRTTIAPDDGAGMPLEGRFDTLFTAYAPAADAPGGAQRAVEMLLEQRLDQGPGDATRREEFLVASHAASAEQPATARLALDMLISQRRSETAIEQGALNVEQAPIVTASAGADLELGMPAASQARAEVASNQPMPGALTGATGAAPMLSEARSPDFIAPDIEHALDVFTDPTPIASARYAVLFPPDRADFDPATELGRASGETRFRYGNLTPPLLTGFHFSGRLLVASR